MKVPSRFKLGINNNDWAVRLGMIAGGGELTLSRQQCAVTKLDALARHRHDPFVMGGNQDAATQSPGGFDDLVHHQLCRCSIERGGWFVGKQQLRNGDKGSGDRHPLLLSDRQLRLPRSKQVATQHFPSATMSEFHLVIGRGRHLPRPVTGHGCRVP